jgi:TonB family protein
MMCGATLDDCDNHYHYRAAVRPSIVAAAALIAVLGGPGEAGAQEALRPPRVREAVEAEVAPEAFGVRTEVAVVLRLTIDTEGSVVSAEVVEGAGEPFDAAAQAALGRFRFEPAHRGEAAITARVLYRYVFRASPPEPEAPVEPSEGGAEEPSHEPAAPDPEEPPALGVVAAVEQDHEGLLERSAEAVDVVSTRAQRHRAVDVGDVLAREPGVAVQRAGGIGSSSRFSLAGLYGDQIRIFLDGVPLAVAGYSFGLSNVPVSIVDRIEIFRGVVPIRFGADALGGAVNLVSTSSQRRTFGVGSYETGVFGTYRASLVGRVYDESSGFSGGVTTFFDHSENDYPVDVETWDSRGRLSPARVRRFHDAYTAFGASLDAGFVNRPWARRLQLRAFGSGYGRELQHNIVMTRPYGAVETAEQVYGGAVVYEQDDFAGEDTELTFVTSLSHRRIDLQDLGTPVDWFGQPVGRGLTRGEIDGSPSDRSIWEWTSFTRAYASWAPSAEHELRVSLTPTYVTRTGEERERPPNERDPLSAARELFTLVSGLSWELRLFEERLENVLFVKHYYSFTDTEEVLPGNVFRRISRDGHHAGVGDALRFRFAEWIWAKASYEYATRLPRADEVFGDGVLVTPNLELAPETSHNVNLGAQLDVRDEPSTGRWRAEASLFGRFTDQLIVPLGNDGTYSHRNVTGATTLGVEASLGWVSPGRYVSIDLNGTYQDQRNTSSEGTYGAFAGDRIPSRPWLFANAKAALRLPDLLVGGDSLTLGWDTRYVHGFFRGWESSGDPETKDAVDAQLVHGISLSYRIEGPATVSTTLDVQNLTDARVYDFFGVQRPGRSFFLKVTAEL